MDWESDDRGDKQVGAIAKALKGAKTLYLATDPDREGEAISWHVRAMLEDKNALKGVDVQRVTFNEITRTAVRAAMAQPRELDHAADRGLPRPPRAGLSGRLHPLAGAVAQAAGQPLGRARAVGRAAADLRARGRDRGLPGPRILDGRGGDAHPRRRAVHRAADASRTARSSTSSTCNNEAAGAAPPRPRSRPAPSPSARSRRSASSATRRRRSPPPPCSRRPAASSAFGAQQTMRLAQQLYEGVDIDGETVGLITYMRTDGVQMAQRGGRRHPRPCQGRVRRRLPARRPARIPEQGQERAGSARGDPPDRRRAHARTSVARILNPDQRAALRADLEARRRLQMQSAELDQVTVDVTDGTGPDPARHRLHRRLRRLPEAVPRGPGRRGGGRGQPHAAADARSATR